MGKTIVQNSMDLLWTNPNPTSHFSAQTLSMNLEPYSRFLILMKRYKTDTITYWTSNIILKGVDALVYATCYNDINIFIREVASSDSGIGFGSGKATTTANQNDEWAIPMRIYGIK